jgi:hypothetical protein
MKFVLLLGATWGLTFAAIAIPGMSTDGGIVGVAVASHLVGVQVAQSVAVQLGGVWSIERLSIWVWLVVLVAAGVGVATGVPALVPCATLSGVVGGLASGAFLAQLLNDGRRMQYQEFLFTRSLAVCFLAAAATGAALIVISPQVAAGAYCVLATGILLLTQKTSALRRDPTPTLVALLGFGGTLFYRNDVNYLRSQLLGEADFRAWHFALTIYVAVQALAGTLIVHVVYARRTAVRRLLTQYIATATLAILGLAAVAVSLSIALVFTSTPSTAAGLASVAAFTVTGMSGLCHVLQTNWVPYIAGSLNAGILLILLASDVDVTIAWGAQLLGLACCLAAGGLLGLARAHNK